MSATDHYNARQQPRNGTGSASLSNGILAHDNKNGNGKSGKERFLLGEQDKEYLDAVERGDDRKARRLMALYL